MASEAVNEDLVRVVFLLAAGVVAGPLFKRLGFGSVLGYLAAGVAIGPSGLAVFGDPAAVLHFAEFGVIMFLFIIGLEMRPARLWKMRGDIFGLGLAQVGCCGAMLTGLGIVAGTPPLAAFIGSMGFVLSSTAIIMQILEERGEALTPQGQRSVSILLLEDLAIVPLLVVVAVLSPAPAEDGSHLAGVAIALAALAGLFVAGRWLLNPMFRLLAAARAREVMTAAALMVVLGAALFMQVGGLSMAMGAFLAGVLLSESAYRHQLEADIEPFRGILLGLFFIAVGMSLDLAVVAADWKLVGAAVAGLMIVKAAGIYAVARFFGNPHAEAVNRAALFAQGGEFAFVLYSAAATAGIIDARTNAILVAAVILSMVLTPFAVIAARRAMRSPGPDMHGIERPDGLTGSVLLIGFGRFGQIASQGLLARGVDVSIIDLDAEQIRNAEAFGFKLYYGDGTRLDVLAASGAASAKVIAVCIDDADAATRIAELVKSEFPQAQLLVRAVDRLHAIQLIQTGVDYQIRETIESALAFGEAALAELGVPEEEIAGTMADIRRRDNERLELEVASGIYAGVGLIHGNAPVPEPLVPPRKPGSPE